MAGKIFEDFWKGFGPELRVYGVKIGVVSNSAPFFLEQMNIDQIQDGAGAFDARNDNKRRGRTESQEAGNADHRRYENLLRRVDEVYTEVVNLRREHHRFVSSLMNQLLPALGARRRKVELSKRERQVHEMRSAGRAEKQIALELGVKVSSVKSYGHRAKKKEQLQREREEQMRKRRL